MNHFAHLLRQLLPSRRPETESSGLDVASNCGPAISVSIAIATQVLDHRAQSLGARGVISGPNQGVDVALTALQETAQYLHSQEPCRSGQKDGSTRTHGGFRPQVLRHTAARCRPR